MCEYCEEERPIRGVYKEVVGWVIDGYFLHGISKTKINFCPMCGRDLREVAE